MALLLYFNGQLLDLEPGQVIAQTKQVNDLNSLENRQTNYTNKFKLPKTGNNLKILDFLSVTGNTSTIPYQHNECSLYSETGECFVYKGRAVITDGGDYFDIVLYDGIIDLFKAIENKNLSDLDLSEISHSKTVDNVVASWTYERPYRYILADYNGDTGNTNTIPGVTPYINIDYLIPSVKVSWLWNRIFQEHQSGYSGSIFNMEEFKNLYMTFPMSIEVIEGENVPMLQASNYEFKSWNASHQNHANGYYFCRFQSGMSNFTGIISSHLNIHTKVAQAGNYKIKVSGRLYGKSGNQQRNSKLYLGLNSEQKASNNVSQFLLIADDIQHGQEFEYTSGIFPLNSSDSICLMATRNTNGGLGYILDVNESNNQLQVELFRVEPSEENFTNAFSDLSVKDFLNEVIYRFGLSIYKDKHSSNYEFLTLQEIVQNADVQNYSKKFISKINEKYIYGSYAQRNYFRYKYNDNESSYNDGYLEVENVNLPSEKTVIQSKIYSPEFNKTRYLYQQSNVYKSFEKEVTEATEDEPQIIEYKQLDKRYYFIKSRPQQWPIRVFSKTMLHHQNVNSFYRESYHKLPFQDVIDTYYQPLNKILDRSLIVTAELWLSEGDVANFDFKKLYYIEQLASHFIMNKIINYVPGKPTKCELVRVYYTPPAPRKPALTLSIGDVRNLSVTLFFPQNPVKNPVIPEYSTDGDKWISTDVAERSPHTVTVPSKGSYQFRLYDRIEDIYSNTISLEI